MFQYGVLVNLISPGSTGDGIDEIIRNTLGYLPGSNVQLVWEDSTQDVLEESNGRCLDK